MSTTIKSILQKCFPPDLWSRQSTYLWASMLFTWLWFDFVWCLGTTFQAFSYPMLWINALSVSFILSIPQMLWRTRTIHTALIIISALWLEANLMYSRTYFTAIPLSSYGLAGNLSDFTASVIDSLRLVDCGFIAIVAFAIITASKRKEKPKSSKTSSKLIYLCYVIVFAAISYAMVQTRGGLHKAWDSFANANVHICRVPIFTVPGSLLHDTTIAEQTLTPQRRKEINQWLAEQPELKAIPGNTGRDNIVLVLCESLESWVVNLKVEGKEITPNLNRLISDSTTFYAPNVVSQVGSGRSIDGQLLINAGMLPMLTGVYALEHPFSTYHTLTKALKGLRGTHSYLLTVDKPVTWNQSAVAQSFGIDTMITRDDWENNEKVGSRKKLGDRSFMRQITERMKKGEIWNNGENVFIQIVTYSGHNPFILPKHLDELNLTKEYPKTVQNYLTMAHYTDQGLGLLIDYIKSRSDYDRTMIVITGDHEGLASERTALSTKSVFVSNIPTVPLIVANSPVGGIHEGIMGQIDIYPTLLQLAGLTDYIWHGMGNSVFSNDFAGVAIDSQGIVYGDTTEMSSEKLRHLLEGREISDRIITFDLLK